jgi:hypothetical protein
LYKERASHEIKVNAELANMKGHTFFGNRFSNVVFAAGKWEQGHWDGKLALEFLLIKPLL